MLKSRLRSTRRMFMWVSLTHLCLLVSCLRYTPSREEISKSGGSEKDKNEYVISEEEFHKHENLQHQRLNQLIAQRQQAREGIEGASYHIGVGDVLEINVFDVPELTAKSVRVRPSGLISLPLLEPIKAAGRNEAGLQQEISKRLDKFLQSPQVSVSISEYAAHKVSVIGEVAKPGSYSLKRDDYSLVELLSEAGGRTQKASGYVVLIPGNSRNNASNSITENSDLVSARALLGEQREGVQSASASLLKIPPQIHGIEIAFDELVGSADKAPLNVPLLPGDTVVIPEVGTVQVDGEVNKPGSYPLASRMTLLGAVASAGSVTYSANVRNVEVIREVAPARKAVLTVDLEQLALGGGNDLRLRDGDVVRVPSAKGRFVTRQFVDILTRIVTFGVSGSVK